MRMAKGSATGPFVRPMNDIPQIVFSNSLQSADWAETTIVSGDLTDAVTRLKQENSGGDFLARAGARFGPIAARDRLDR